MLTCWLSTSVTLAAMPELVGVIELLVEDSTVKTLGLTDDQLSKLTDLADQREIDGIEEAVAASRMSPDEQQAKLAPFRLESEKQGLAILTDAQRAKLAELLADNENPLYDSVDKILASGAAKPNNQPASTKGPGEEPTGPEPAMPAPPADDKTVAVDGQAASAGVASQAADASQTDSRPQDDGKLSFNFRFQPWPDVLDWFADQADLSLVLDAPPSGTFNYRDSRRYTVGEALDVLNNVLQTKGFTLLRKDRMLLLVNLEDEIPPNLITDVPLEDLQNRGEHELIRVLFRVRSMPSAELAEELKELVGPQGKIIVLSKANMIQVTETAGRIRTIRSVIDSLDGPADGDIRELGLQFVMVDEVLPVIRQMLGIASDAYATPSGSLQMAVDPLGGKIFARGDAKQVARLEEVVKLVDVPDATLGASTNETLQLEVYSTGGADCNLVLKVLQTLLAEAPGVRLAADADTGNLVALARPADHATIRATLSQMQQDARQVKVIPLDRVDPSLAKLAVDKLFNSGTEEKPDPRAPIVEADFDSYSLIVRATPPQIAEIKNLLDQLGESGAGNFTAGERGNIRVLPLTGASARNALAQVQQIWPSMRANKIRIVTPSAGGLIQEYRPSDGSRQAPPGERPPSFFQEMDDLMRSLEGQGGAPPVAPDKPPAAQDPSARAPASSLFRFAVQQQAQSDQTLQFKSKSGATIIVAAGPGGLLLASEDTAALDEFEDLLRAASGQAAGVGRQFAVFYLKYADASVAAEILGNIFGSGGGGGGMMEGIAGAALNEMGGGMMGDLLGLGGGGDSAGFASASVDIVPDMRLNALIVYANPQDLDTVDQLMRVLDQRTGPATVEAGGRPRLIPVVNSSAAAVAEVVKQVYQDRLQQAAGGGGQPSPRDIMKMLQRGGGAGASSVDQEPTKMTIGVDTRSNSLIVRAPDPLFEEVQLLVKQLDEEGLETPQSTRIISLQHSNAEAVKDALESLLGSESVTASSTPTSGANSKSNGNRSSNAAADLQRRIEFFRQMQRANQGNSRRPSEGRSRSGSPSRRSGDRRRGR